MQQTKIKTSKSSNVKEHQDLEAQSPIPSILASRLLDWYDAGHRMLPWREQISAYRVWISEIMLQQTRVEAVKPYFERFMHELPDVRSLSCVDDDRLMKLWEGLGYYNRARNLKKCAQIVCEEYDGEFPSTYEELIKLPGIGSYTASAISSIVFGEARPAVDGNVLRVLGRLRCDDRLITDAKVKTAIEQELLPLIPKDRAGDFNQAMMEIGACVCLPNGAPHCVQCPLTEICLAKKEGKISEYPKKAAKKKRVIEEKTVLVIRAGERLVLHKRPEKGLLARLYEFPNLDQFATKEEVVTYLQDKGLEVERITKLEDAKHIFTHKEWMMKGFMIHAKEWKGDSEWILIDPIRTKDEFALPSAFESYTKLIRV